ncbi:hypothetical protein CROQUDRAFT_660321 [Cronartium quercuum f. sp. fusiforme G11]|uniref:Uncharacterized protein n=1 Tax=Cronartium quercuum f. sp. fusiforme G11 TaxID=708437 RepID=A0A9P6NHJ5_9BASI|nr:hypothetical protein CROQUDRAFT_660321 [Cronartium quercuum f. sp. fusiforme G11]
MLPNHNASASKTLINQARNISHPYLQAQAQPTTSNPYAHIQAPRTQASRSTTNQAKVVRNEDEGM